MTKLTPKMRLISVQEVESLMAQPKMAVLPFEWQALGGYCPSLYKWQSAVMVNGVVVEGLRVGMQWQQGEPGEIAKFYTQLIYNTGRVYAVDMGVQRHRNCVVPGRAYSGQDVTAEVHEHRWIDGCGDKYVEPLVLTPDEHLVYNHFCAAANITVPGVFAVPGGVSGSLF